MTATLNTATALATIAPSINVRFVTKKDIDWATGRVKEMGEMWQQAVQEVQISVLNHIEQHGDISLFVNLFNALPKGARRNALAEHAVKYGKLDINLSEDPKARKAKPFLYNRDKATDLKGATDEPWFEMSPEKPVDQAFDFKAQLLALLKKADKAANDPLKNFQGKELLAEARKLVAL